MSDIVKSPRITLSNTENYMSGTNKPSGESKPQQPPKPPEPKPSPAQPDRFKVNRMIVGDSAEGLRKKGK